MSSLLTQCLLAFTAGLLMNLTPCVLPAIPLKVRMILDSAESEGRPRVGSAMAFLVGTLLLFALVGGAMAFLRLQWGFLFQSEWFLLLLILVLLSAGLATFFDWSLRLPQALYRLDSGGHLKPFLAGILTAVLATPCTGPFLGGVLTFGLSQPPLLFFGLFLLVGLGLSLPYLLLLFYPRWLSKFPVNTEWSPRIKELLAFILWGGAVFFARSLVAEFWSLTLVILWGTLLVLWGVRAWLCGPSLANRMLPLLTAVVSLTLLFTFYGHSPGSELHWQPYSTAVLASLAGDRPILIEFTADWCLNCKVLESTVYADPLVLEAARDIRLLAFRVDLTESDPFKLKLLLDSGGAGLPFALVLNRQQEIVRRLPDLFTAEALTSALRRADR